MVTIGYNCTGYYLVLETNVKETPRMNGKSKCSLRLSKKLKFFFLPPNSKQESKKTDVGSKQMMATNIKSIFSAGHLHGKDGRGKGTRRGNKL